MKPNPCPPRPAGRLTALLPAALIALALAALAWPAASPADSIVYVKGGDVYLSGPGGEREVRLTTTGGYGYVSQSENGVIAAANGSRIHRLSRTGEVEAAMPTIVGDSSWYGPWDTEISPDGAKIAYEAMYDGDGWGLRTAVGYLDTATGRSIGEVHTGWGHPSWIDGESLFMSGAPNALSEDVIHRRAGEPNNVGRQWFSHPDAGGVSDGDITRAGDKMAFVGGDGAYLVVYSRTGEIGVDVPEYCYHHTEPEGKFADPAFSPDGTRLAWQEDDGIHVGSVPSFAGGCRLPEDDDVLRIPGGSQPDWSPAGLPAQRGPDGPPDDGGPGGPGGGRPVIELGAKPRLKAALARGLTVTVSGLPAGSKVTATASRATARKAGLGRRSKQVAKGRTAASGRAKLAFAKRAARKLARLRSLPLTLKAAGGGRSATLALTLKR